MSHRINGDSVILIVGGTGSIGSIIAQKILESGAREVRVLARDETRHQQLADSLGRPANLMSIVGDVRDCRSLDEALEGVDVVINAAAMKHVKYCEEYPYEAYKTNVGGTQNLIAGCLQKKIKTFVLASTDKAADPSTAYGASKFMAERVVISAAMRNPGYQFVSVRFGNVLGSRNSVLPRLHQLLDTGMPITVVRDFMTRYVMTRDQAAELVIEALNSGQGGEIFTLDMPVVQVQDLIESFVNRYARSKAMDPKLIEIIEHKSHRGEKAHEALFSAHEHPRVYRHGHTLIIAPDTQDDSSKTPASLTYNSEHAPRLSASEIDTLLELAHL